MPVATSAITTAKLLRPLVVKRNAVTTPSVSRVSPALAGLAPNSREDLISAEDFAFRRSRPTSVVARHDLPVRPFDGFGQVLVVRFVRLLGELDVDGDDPRAGFTKVIDHARVVGARERETDAGVFLKLPERRIVDLDEHDVRRRRLRPADREAGVDGLQFGAPEQVRRVGEHAESGGQDGHRDQQSRLPSPPRRPTHFRAPCKNSFSMLDSGRH